MKQTDELSSSSFEDVHLIQRIVEQRDREAMEFFYRRYWNKLSGFLYRILLINGLVEEVYNDIMMIVWQKASQFNGSSKVSTWVFSIAYRQCLQLKRKESKHYSEELTEQFEPALESDEVGDYQQQRVMKKALADLSVEHRSVIELSYYVGCNYAEIAIISGCPENTVKTRMFHARRKLKDSLLKLGESSLAQV